jgi:hypothetical protein
VFLNERARRSTTDEQAASMVLAGILLHLATLAVRRLSSQGTGPTPCPACSDRLRERAAAAGAHLLAATRGDTADPAWSRWATPANQDPTLVACLGGVRDRPDATDLEGRLRLAWAAAWIDELYAVGTRLEAVLSFRPATEDDGVVARA